MLNKSYFSTWSVQSSSSSVAITGGEGAFYDCKDGTRWLDLGSLSYQASLGHGHTGVTEAIVTQARELCLAPPSAEFSAKTKLADALLALAPKGFSKVFFTLGGSEANENAMKIARLFTRRLKFISRYRSYHGATLGALALTGDYRRPPLEPVLGNVIHVLGDDPSYLEEVLALEGRESVAAVFMEPIPGANGVLLPRKDYWPRMRAACDATNTLLVTDEVLTGFGRTGKCFGFEHEGVVPDMITVAKALTAGYAPLGAVLVHERIASFFDDNVLYAGLTNYAHPLGCAAALATLEAYKKGSLLTRAAQLEEGFLGCLQKACQKNPHIASNARGRGLLGAIDIHGTPAFWRVLKTCVAKRFLSLHLDEARGTAIFAPPLIIEEDDLHRGIGDFSEALTEAKNNV